MTDITIAGLSAKQKAFADIFWGMETQEQVKQFIAVLPKADRKDAETVLEMMILAFTDEVTATDLAKKALAQFRL